MKTRFAYKIFWAFLIMSLITIVPMTGLMRYYAVRHFAVYVNKVEIIISVYGQAYKFIDE